MFKSILKQKDDVPYNLKQTDGVTFNSKTNRRCSIQFKNKQMMFHSIQKLADDVPFYSNYQQ